MNIFTLGPDYREEEHINLLRLNKFLGSYGFNTYSSFFEADLIKAMNNNEFGEDKIKLLSNLSLAMDLFYMINSADCCVAFLNGRVPDEAMIIKIGIAYIIGLPVILYKYDSRTAFMTGDNSMILGLSKCKSVSKLDQLINRINKVNIEKNKKLTFEKMPPYLQLLEELGKEIFDFYLLNKDKTNLFNLLIGQYRNHTIINEIENIKTKIDTNNKNIINNKLEIIADKVYCSGPLFSTDENREMQNVCNNLEKYNFTAYLPERDGAEAYVMGSVSNPFTGSIIAKPLINYINKLIFCVDIAEIIKCSHFIININGRAYDEGAMAELGMAFALGKPITVFHNDSRGFINGLIHPVVRAVSYWTEIIEKYEDAACAVRVSEQLTNNLNNKFGFCLTLNETVNCIMNKGNRSIKRLKKLKKPENKMVKWLED